MIVSAWNPQHPVGDPSAERCSVFCTTAERTAHLGSSRGPSINVAATRRRRPKRSPPHAARSAPDGLQASQGIGACVSEAPTAPTQGLALGTINQLGGSWS